MGDRGEIGADPSNGCPRDATAGSATVGGERPVPLRGSAEPFLVINEAGQEVAALVPYGQYISLLALVAERMGRSTLPAYWRRALDGCLAVDQAVQPPMAVGVLPVTGGGSAGREVARADRP